MAKVKALPPTEDITNYVGVMRLLRSKGMTLRATADYLSQEFGRKVTHTTVYRLLKASTQVPPEARDDYQDFVQDQIEEVRALRQEFDEEERRGLRQESEDEQ